MKTTCADKLEECVIIKLLLPLIYIIPAMEDYREMQIMNVG